MYTWKEITIRKLKKYGKKSFFNKQIAKISIYAICFICYVANLFLSNVKRMISLFALWLFFVASCSFALPGIIETNDVDNVASVVQIQAENKNDEQIEAILAGDEDALLDDEDVTYGPNDEEISNVDVALYSATDILLEAQGEKSSEETSMEVETSMEEEISMEEETVLLSSLDKDDWKLILINKQHPVPDDYEFTLGTIKGGMECDERILNDLFAMLLASKEDNISLVICSPYRDYNRQTLLFNRKIKGYIAKGLTYSEAYSVASTQVTAPGASEHQIGLALDIVCTTHTALNYGFGDTPAGIWLAENSYKYGFILRYPNGAGDITGIIYEPWHFRYVGIEAATYIKQNNITLEELTERLDAQ